MNGTFITDYSTVHIMSSTQQCATALNHNIVIHWFWQPIISVITGKFLGIFDQFFIVFFANFEIILPVFFIFPLVCPDYRPLFRSLIFSWFFKWNCPTFVCVNVTQVSYIVFQLHLYGHCISFIFCLSFKVNTSLAVPHCLIFV